MDNSSRPTGAYVPAPRPSRKAAKAWNVPVAGAGVAAVVGLAWLLAPGFDAPKPVAVPLNEAPPSEAALAMPERVPARAQAHAIQAPPRRAEAERTATTEFAQAAPPAWAGARVSQDWVWPRHMPVQGDGYSIDRRLVGWYPANAADKRLLYSLTVDRVETRLYEDQIPAFEARLAAEEEARRKAQEEFEERRAKALAAPQPTVATDAQREAAALEYTKKWTPEQLARIKRIRKEEIARMMPAKGATSVRDVTSHDGRGMAKAEFTYADGHKEVVAYDPLVFDLKGSGIKTSLKKVLFDLFAYGKSDKTQWMNDLEDGTGVLVFDAKGSGRAGKNGSEVFGDRTDLAGVGRPDGYADGFQALRALVGKAVKEGVLKQDAVSRGILDSAALESLEKAYGLKMKLGGFNHEPVSLAAAGVQAIALSGAPTHRAADFDGQSNDLVLQPGAVFLRSDGTTGSYMNVWLKAKLGNLGLKTQSHLNL